MNIGAQSADIFTEQLSELAQNARLLYNISPLSALRPLSNTSGTEFLVEDPKTLLRTVLSLRGPEQSREAIAGEIAWVQEILKNSRILVPEPIPGRNGSIIQSVTPGRSDSSSWHCVMFSYLSGTSYDECGSDELSDRFVRLGETTAMLHQSILQWSNSADLQRPVLDFSAASRLSARQQPGDSKTSRLFEQAGEKAMGNLAKYGKAGRCFGLIHTDLRFSNLFFCRNRPAVVNFSHCAYGWYMYDCATALSNYAGGADYQKSLSSWLQGYRKIRKITRSDIAEIPTFIILNRLYRMPGLYAGKAEEAADADGKAEFIRKTAELCERYLSESQHPEF